LNELYFWTLSIVWCLKKLRNKNIYTKKSQYTRPKFTQGSPDDGSRTSFRNVVSLFLQAIVFVGYYVFVGIYIGIMAPLRVLVCEQLSLISTWVFPWLLMFQGVCGCACALVCMRY
jgi:hypothetical protein